MAQLLPTENYPKLVKKPRSTLVSRNITVSGHRTSVRLEPEMWSGLSDICRRERATLNEVCSIVANSKPDNSSLTAAIRVFVMAYFRAATTEEGHVRCGHGRGAAMLYRPLTPQQTLAPIHNPNLIGTAIPSPQPSTATTQQTATPSANRTVPYMIGSGRINGR